MGEGLVNNQLWFEGPEFLKQDHEHWPKTPAKEPSKNVLAESDLMKNPPMLTHSLVNKLKIDMKEIMDIGKFSSKLS